MADISESPSLPNVRSSADPKTGNEILDEDLKLFFEMVKDEARCREVTTAIADLSLTEEAFEARVPERLVYLIVFLSFPHLFQGLRESVSKDSQSVLDRARELVQERFRDLAFHPAAGRVLQRFSAQEKEGEEGQNPLAESLASIHRLVPVPMWVRGPEGFYPAVRIGLIGLRNKLLLDTSLDWGDLTFVCRAFANILREDMSQGERYGKLDLVMLSEEIKMRFRENVEELSIALREISSLASTFGIILKPDTSEPEARDSISEGVIEESSGNNS